MQIRFLGIMKKESYSGQIYCIARQSAFLLQKNANGNEQQPKFYE